MNSIGPLLAIRADADNRRGTGHVMRTLAIAQEWLDRGGRVSYFSAQLPPLLKERLLTCGCEIIEIDATSDAASTSLEAERLKAAVLLVDHYDLSADWWKSLPTQRRWKTTALNDFAQPLHPDADLRFSPTAKEIPGEHSGPAFLLIRKELLRQETPPLPPERARNVLLLLGGADPLNAGPTIATQILDTDPSLQLRVIVGPAAKNLADFQVLEESFKHLEIVHAPDNLAPHIQWADTAVVSPSTTAFEVLHHGRVTGFVVSADNQGEVADALAAKGCALKLGDVRDGDRTHGDRLRKLLGDPIARRDLASAGAALVDGRGAKRICDLLGFPEMDFRPATADDAAVLWEWANDATTRAASFSQREIPWEEHLAWLEGRLRSPDPCWIATTPFGERIALLRFDRENVKTFTISLNIAPTFRGKGLAALLVSKACEKFRADRGLATIHAWIRPENAGSIRCFERAAFEKSADGAQADRLLFTRLL